MQQGGRFYINKKTTKKILILFFHHCLPTNQSLTAFYIITFTSFFHMVLSLVRAQFLCVGPTTFQSNHLPSPIWIIVSFLLVEFIDFSKKLFLISFFFPNFISIECTLHCL